MDNQDLAHNIDWNSNLKILRESWDGNSGLPSSCFCSF